MLEFMNREEFDQYGLSDRIRDCEPNLHSFNYITPMAVCIEAMIKSTWLEYKKGSLIEDAEELPMAKVYNDNCYKDFRHWLSAKYGIEKDLMHDVYLQIHKESNKYKHHLQRFPKRGYAEKRARFVHLYNFTVKFFEYKTGEEAPPWSEEEFSDLLKPDDARIIEHVNTLMTMR